MPRSQLTAFAAWLAAGLFVLAAWMLVPRDRGADGPPVHALLVDVSASAIGADGLIVDDVCAHCAAIARSAIDAGAEVFGVVYGHGARSFDVARGLSASDLVHGEDQTDLAAALSLCELLGRTRDLRSIEVIGDGTWTGVDPSAVAGRLAARGVRITVLDDGYRGFGEAIVAPIDAPVRVRRGEPIRVEVEAWAWLPDPGRYGARELVVTATCTDGDRVRTQRTTVAAQDLERADRTGVQRLAFEFAPLEGSLAHLEFHAQLVDVARGVVGRVSDKYGVARAEIQAEGVLTLGLVGDRAACADLRAVLSDSAADLALVDLAAAELADASKLAGIDVLATVDATFDSESAAAIDRFVASGGGWVDLAGSALGVSLRPRAAALAPAPDDPRPREIVVLVDASGSMSGAPAQSARAALARLVDVVRVEDGVRALWFSENITPRIDLGRPGERADPARRRAVLARIAASPEPRGATRIWSALDTAFDDVDAAVRTLFVLVSDGRDPDRSRIAARAESLRGRVSTAGADLAVVAVGNDPDRELLDALAGGSANVFDAGDLTAAGAAERLVRELQRAAASGSIIDDPDPQAPLPVGAATGFAASFRDAPDFVVRRFARARANRGAEVVWTSHASAAGTPLLAFARTGLGASAGFAFLPQSSWLSPVDRFGGAVATTVRAVAPPSDRARLRLDLEDGDLVLRGVPDGTPAVVRAEILAPGGPVWIGDPIASVDLLAVRPGRDPLHDRAAAIPSELARLAVGGPLVARVLGLGDDLEIAIPAPRAPEYRRPSPAFAPPEPRAASARTAGFGPHPAGAWVLALGFALLALAAFLNFFSRSRR